MPILLTIPRLICWAKHPSPLHSKAEAMWLGKSGMVSVATYVMLKLTIDEKC